MIRQNPETLNYSDPDNKSHEKRKVTHEINHANQSPYELAQLNALIRQPDRQRTKQLRGTFADHTARKAKYQPYSIKINNWSHGLRNFKIRKRIMLLRAQVQCR